MDVLVVVSFVAVVKLVGLLKRRFLARRHVTVAQSRLDSQRPSACMEVGHGTR